MMVQGEGKKKCDCIYKGRVKIYRQKLWRNIYHKVGVTCTIMVYRYYCFISKWPEIKLEDLIMKSIQKILIFSPANWT